MKATMKTSISKKVSLFMIATIGIMGICLLAVGFIGVWRMRFDTIGQRQEQDARIFSEFIAQQIEDEVGDVKAYVGSPWWQEAVKEANLRYVGWESQAIEEHMARMDASWGALTDSQLQEWLGTRMGRRLEVLAKQDGVIAEIFLTDQYGGLVAASNKTSDFYQADEEWWQRAYHNGQGDDFFSEVELDQSSGKISSAIAVPIKDETGQVIGIAKAALDIVVFFQPLAKYKFGKTGHVELVDKQGNIVYCSGLYPMGKSGFSGVELVRILSGKNSFEVFPFGPLKTMTIVAAAKVKSSTLDANGIHWVVVVSQDKNEIFLPLYRVFGIGFILILIVLFLAMVIMQRNIRDIFISPLKKIRDGMQRFSRGEQDYRIDLKTGDEIEDLADVFNRMTQDLKRTSTSVENLNKEIAERKKVEMEREIVLKRQWDVNALQQLLLAPATLEDKLKLITDGIVRIFDADFCRIWLIKPGDLCEKGCIHAQVKEGPHVCRYRDKCLHLMTSSGRYTHIDGKGHARVPFGCYKIGLVASGQDHKFLTNDVVNDPFVPNHEWARELGLVSFAGYQIRIPEGETMGVLALFAKHPILQGEDAMLDTLSSAVAFVIEEFAAGEALTEAMKVKSDFTSTVSHELRTPLTAIREGIAIVLEGSAGDINEEQKDFLSLAKRNVDRLGRLINDVLDFQKLEAQKMVFSIQENDINELVREVHDTMAPLAEKKSLGFVLKLQEGLPRVKFDRDKMAQVLTNLVNNAIKFAEKGHIAIATSRMDRIIQVSVEDTGPGIKEEDMGRLFQPFSQLEKVIERKTGGTGLGLAISKEIVERHKGRIWAESPPAGGPGVFGKGTAFCFSLPVKEKDKVLVIDDDRVMLDLIKNFLEKKGHSVMCSEKGLDAVAIISRDRPDLIILDMKLKDTSGYEVIGRLRSSKDTLKIPIIVMSGYSEELSKIEDKQDELALVSIAKPFDLEDLLSMAAKLLQQRY